MSQFTETEALAVAARHARRRRSLLCIMGWHAHYSWGTRLYCRRCPIVWRMQP